VQLPLITSLFILLADLIKPWKLSKLLWSFGITIIGVVIQFLFLVDSAYLITNVALSILVSFLLTHVEMKRNRLISFLGCKVNIYALAKVFSFRVEYE
jgi:hypothetical protein